MKSHLHSMNPGNNGLFSDRPGHFVRSGAVAGVVSVLVFTLAHQLLINNIWLSFPIMAAAGGACGASLAWTYGLLFKRPSFKNWLGYNLFYDAVFLLLAAVSVAVFEPVISMAALLAGGPPPPELTAQGFPLVALFIVLTTAAAALLFRARRWAQWAALLLTSALLLLLLGMNVALIGLVGIPDQGGWVVAEFFGYILLLNAVFVATFILLERTNLSTQLAAAPWPMFFSMSMATTSPAPNTPVKPILWVLSAILTALLLVVLTACGAASPVASSPEPSPTSSSPTNASVPSPTPTPLPPPTNTPTPTPTPDVTANFKTFVDSFGQVTLQYPPGWTLDAIEETDRIQIMIASDQEGFAKVTDEDHSQPVGFLVGEVGLTLDFLSVSARRSGDPERMLDDAIERMRDDAIENARTPFTPVGERSVGERDGMRFASQRFEANNASGTLQGTMTTIVSGMRIALFLSGATVAGADEYLPLVQAAMDSIVVHPWSPEVQADLSTPERTLEALFEAARTGDFTVLAGLCDPLGENDRDTEKICDLAADDPLRASFVEYFGSGKVNGEAVISADGNTAEVPFLFGPNGDLEETMRLIKRDGNWYLLDY